MLFIARLAKRSYTIQKTILEIVLKKWDWFQIIVILKNLHFLPYHYETLSIWLTHEKVILPESYTIWNKIVDFFLLASFLTSLILFVTV